MKAEEPTKRIVIDTNVICYTSLNGKHPFSRHSRELMELIRNFCHKMLINTSFENEFKKHAYKKGGEIKNSFSIEYKRIMETAEKVLDFDEKPFTDIFLQNKAEINKDHLKDIEKDCWIFDLAKQTDKIVLTREIKVLNLISLYPSLSNAVSDIHFVLVTEDVEQHGKNLAWIRANCPDDEGFRFARYNKTRLK